MDNDSRRKQGLEASGKGVRSGHRWCPFVGTRHDALTPYAFPTAENHCHKVAPPAWLSADHQRQFCLSRNHRSCLVFQNEEVCEWRTFLEGAGLTGIRTRVAHPQSNGRLERLHRTHREEGFAAEALTDHYQALDAMAEWADCYNHQRPHSALDYLRPVDYYRGDPAARLAEREQKLVAAVAAREAYWNGL